MKKTTQENLSKRLLKYGAFSAAILGTANSNGQIVYTDIADETILPGNSYAVDIDVDSTGDLVFRVNTTANFNFLETIDSAAATVYNSNGFIGFTSAPYNYPSNLNAGDIIDSNQTFLTEARGDMNYSSCAYPGSQFCDGMEGFIGVSLVIGTETHYGWIRVEVASDNSSTIIKDFAYNTTPGEAIEAGQTTLSNDVFDKAFTGIIATDNQIKLSNLPDNVTYNVYDITGKSVLSGETNGSDFIIDANGVSNGVYIVELNATNSILRKKIVL